MQILVCLEPSQLQVIVCNRLRLFISSYLLKFPFIAIVFLFAPAHVHFIRLILHMRHISFFVPWWGNRRLVLE